MKKDGTIQIKGKDIKLDASGKIVGTASGKMTLKGSKISQN
jgi:type VI secretion system secreted protein VgrG